MKWKRWLDSFAKDLSARGFAARSQEGYTGAVGFFLGYLKTQHVDDPQDLTPTVIEAYQGQLFERRNRDGHRLALSTQAIHLAAVRSFCAFLTRRGVVLLDPARDLVLPKVVRKLPRSILTREETIRFLRAIRTKDLLGLRDRAIFETLYSTGLRVTELIRLIPQDLDLEEGFLQVRVGKGGRGRVIPLGKVAVAWIRRYLDATRDDRSPGDPLFISLRGSPLIRGHLAARARRVAKRAGIDKRVTCHTFRITCATHMLQGRASLRHIQELLGHSSPTTTQIYAQVDIQDLKRVHQRCHPRNRTE